MMDFVFENTTVADPPAFYGPTTLTYRQFKIGVQKIRDNTGALHMMTQRHWNELQPAPGDLLVDWSTLISMEHAGRAILVLARTPEEVAGYFIGTVSEPIFQSNVQVFTEVGFYVDPWARKYQLGRVMLRYVEALAKYLDFDRLEIFGLRLPDGRSPDALYRRAGYDPVAVQYQKELVK